MPASICPVAILLAMWMMVSSEVPQARCRVMPGVSGDRPERQRSLAAQVPVDECLITAPIATSPSCWPCRPKLLDQRAQRAHRHAQVADIGIGRVLPAERDADAAEDGDGTAVLHGLHLAAPAAAGIMAAV
jgi:hypothetical protein